MSPLLLPRPSTRRATTTAITGIALVVVAGGLVLVPASVAAPRPMTGGSLVRALRTRSLDLVRVHVLGDVVIRGRVTHSLSCRECVIDGAFIAPHVVFARHVRL